MGDGKKGRGHLWVSYIFLMLNVMFCVKNALRVTQKVFELSLGDALCSSY